MFVFICVVGLAVVCWFSLPNKISCYERSVVYGLTFLLIDNCFEILPIMNDTGVTCLVMT